MHSRLLAFAATLAIPTVAFAQNPPAPAPAPAPAPNGAPAPAPNPYGQPAPNPYGQPAPAPNPYGQPAPAPNPYGQPAPNPYGQPAPNPYGQPPPNPYGQPPPNPYGQPPPVVEAGPPPPPPGQTELVVDFGAIGLLAGITIDVRGVDNSGLGTIVLLASTAGGGALGLLLADRTQATRGDAYLTSLGLMVGAANGALLLQPLHDTNNADQVLSVLTLSSAIGAGAGFAISRGEKLTAGQSMFATNATLLGFGSAALIASINNPNNFTNGDITALTIGLDAGALAGLVLAPKITWSARRANEVAMGTLVGTFAGGLVAGLAAPKTKNSDGSSSTDFDPAFVSTSLLIGAWAGFGGAIYLTKDMPPDPKFDPRFQTAANPPVTVMPFIRGDAVGAAVGGTF